MAVTDMIHRSRHPKKKKTFGSEERKKKVIFFPTHFLCSQTPPYSAFFSPLSLLNFLFILSFFPSPVLHKSDRAIREKKRRTVGVTRTHTQKGSSFSNSLSCGIAFSPMGARCSKFSLCWWPSNIKSNLHDLSDNNGEVLFSHFTCHFLGTVVVLVVEEECNLNTKF